MNRFELAQRLSRHEPPLPAADCEFAIKVILEGLSTALVRGDRVEIRGFGTLTVNTRAAHEGRNPKTGEIVEIAARCYPRFKPAKEMRERVNASSAAA